jgi:N-acetylneuraminate synthase
MKLGYMVSLRDVQSLSIDGSDFTELLLFGRDSEHVNPDLLMETLRRAIPPIEFVHAPEFISDRRGESLLDLSSENESLRKASLRAVKVARDIAATVGDAKVVVHPGGIRGSVGDREKLLSNLEMSLSKLGPSKLLLENMPWYYWNRRFGRMVANICITVEDMERLRPLVEGFALDLCHGHLSRPEGDPAYCEEFLSVFGKKVRHVHASDARAPDQEGLQIGEGEIDFSILRRIDVPILVEIWRGHEHNGKGFRLGIERLRALEKDH